MKILLNRIKTNNLITLHTKTIIFKPKMATVKTTKRKMKAKQRKNNSNLKRTLLKHSKINNNNQYFLSKDTLNWINQMTIIHNSKIIWIIKSNRSQRPSLCLRIRLIFQVRITLMIIIGLITKASRPIVSGRVRIGPELWILTKVQDRTRLRAFRAIGKFRTIWRNNSWQGRCRIRFRVILCAITKHLSSMESL